MIQERVITYRGRVQGVGFRYTTTRVADRFAVTGFVQNLPDGRVLLTAQGEPDELDRFITAVNDAMSAYIDGREVEERPAGEPFASFSVRH